MPNENCLEGLACPICGHDESLQITVEHIVLMRDDGHDFDHSKHSHWDDDSQCQCPTCEYTATVQHFDLDNAREVRTNVRVWLLETLEKEWGPNELAEFRSEWNWVLVSMCTNHLTRQNVYKRAIQYTKATWQRAVYDREGCGLGLARAAAASNSHFAIAQAVRLLACLYEEAHDEESDHVDIDLDVNDDGLILGQSCQECGVYVSARDKHGGEYQWMCRHCHETASRLC